MSKKLEVVVTDSGVQFGGAWFSHESITGYTAEQLNAGDCHVTGNQYMQWLSQDAAQSELAALREELADETRRANVNALNARHAKQDLNTIQHRLTAAEQRNSDLIDLIQKAHTWVDRNNCGGWDAYELRDELAASMNKPTESGASE